MPNKPLYKWEDNNQGMYHKCGTCATPMSSPRAKKTCFGKHEVVCKRYHKTFFFPRSTNSCAPCRQTDESHIKRHREIVLLVRLIKENDESVYGGSSISGKRKPKWATTILNSDVARDPEEFRDQRGAEEWNDASTLVDVESDLKDHTQRGPKKSLTNGEPQKSKKTPARRQIEIETVSELELEATDITLHPNLSARVAEHHDEALLSLDHDTIEENLAYHAHTSKLEGHGERGSKANTHLNVRSLNEHSKQRTTLVNSILEQLGLDPTVKRTAKGRNALAKLKKAISIDIDVAANEEAKRMERMAGYWRYANRRTYNRMVRLNEIWDWSTGAKLHEIDEETDDGETADGEGDGAFSGCTEIGSSGPATPEKEMENCMEGLNLEDELLSTLGTIEDDVPPGAPGPISKESKVSFSGILENNNSKPVTRANPGQQSGSTPECAKLSSSVNDCILDDPDVRFGKYHVQAEPPNALDRPTFKNPWTSSNAAIENADGKNHQADDSSDHLPPDPTTPSASAEIKPPTPPRQPHRALSLPALCRPPKSSDKNNRYNGLEIELPAPREEDEQPSPPETALFVPSTFGSCGGGVSASVSGGGTTLSDVFTGHGVPTLPVAPARSLSTAQQPLKVTSLSISIETMELLRAREDAVKIRRMGRGKRRAKKAGASSGVVGGDGGDGEWTTVLR